MRATQPLPKAREEVAGVDSVGLFGTLKILLIVQKGELDRVQKSFVLILRGLLSRKIKSQRQRLRHESLRWGHGQSEMLNVGKNYYSLIATGEANLSQESLSPSIKNYFLSLVSRGQPQKLQELFSSKEALIHDGHPEVIWSGDIDRDGKLDLILNLRTHYNLSRITLFLSSVAKGTEIVTLVAELSTSGC